jgi:hypothetical protein
LPSKGVAPSFRPARAWPGEVGTGSPIKAMRQAMRPCAAVAQMVRAPDCGSGGRWFEASQLYHTQSMRHRRAGKASRSEACPPFAPRRNGGRMTSRGEHDACPQIERNHPRRPIRRRGGNRAPLQRRELVADNVGGRCAHARSRAACAASGRPRRGREAWPSVRIDADRSKVRAAERRWAYAATPQRFAAWLINKFSLDALVQYRNGGGT